MGAPWEKYQSQQPDAAGPWAKYAAAAEPTSKPSVAAKPENQPGVIESFAANAGKGFGSTVLGAQQLFGEILKKFGADQVGEWLANDAKDGARRLDSQAKPYADAHPVAAVAGDITGAIVNPINRVVPLAGAKTAGGLIARSGAQGVVSGLANPVTDGSDYWTEKATQGAVGGAAGVAVPAVTGAAARVLKPKAAANPDVQALLDEGVRLTPGQAAGGFWKVAEEKARSLPILGDAITAAQKRGGEDLNLAVLNRGMAKLSEATGGPAKVAKSGSAGLQELRQAAGDAYDNLLPKMMANTGEPQYAQSMASLKGLVQSLPAQEAKQFDNILTREVDQRLAPNGVLSGDNLKSALAALRDKASSFSSSTDAYQRELGSALKQAEQELRGLVERSNPQYAKELSAINEAYRVMKTAQKASSSVAAEDGIFTPSQLHNAVKAADKSKDKRAFAEGSAYLQDLSGPGKRVLASQYPDSGTAGRLALGGGALASGFASPSIPLSLLLASGTYVPPVQQAAVSAIARRGPVATKLSDLVRKSTPFLVAPGVAAANQ